MPISKNGKAYYTKEQYEIARYDSSALEYAQAQGYSLIRQGSYYTMAEHDSMIFTPRGNWFWNSRHVSGGALEFMIYYEGKTLTEAVLTLAYIGRKNLSLSGANVISDTYDDKKLRNAIKDVFTNGFHQINHYTGTYYPAINLVVVENGRHHLSAAMVKNSGSASLQICDLKKAYEVLKTDGAFWYLDGLRISSVPDARLAILYELARTKDALMLVDVDYSLAQYPVPQNINPLNAYREEHFRSNLLELELQIKKYQISQLRKEVPNEDTGDVQSLEDKMAALRKEFNDWIDFEGQQLLRFYEENPPSNHFPPSQY